MSTTNHSSQTGKVFGKHSREIIHKLDEILAVMRASNDKARRFWRDFNKKHNIKTKYKFLEES
ncbi:hypothetical protein A2188_03260 [Candidatus Woesebacteria bacterium RIFOXYA1_FULL_43_9]|uniref:Uncharacterized protein n=1 Tax=Candidatus Woesebacteria bacterium RIFOXYA1_FULL_43_9 TaxID=1802534 RepID=A0A1F8CJV7_9BACT|nr:MAG: hypothetical protein A2188_03260 [Candidatus Woesebacteria bacterium RIFOXYA1_FULL_43_9]